MGLDVPIRLESGRGWDECPGAGRESDATDDTASASATCARRDGVQLAWAEAGAGPLLVKAANWLTHLEFEWESPVWRHWIRFFSEHFRFVRYDERGCGMTDWNVGDLSFERWIERSGGGRRRRRTPREPFALLGISQGAAACIDYAVRHPERVSRLILYGGYARGCVPAAATPKRSASTARSSS